ncbi:Outer membrane protein OprM [bioreactor metagenome]|uniref:Outer membrane protein OprM n=1 Tax=bioreactor metagenome TaxID=1076179 RepID=A0A645GTQ6_9ZZZZ
MNQLAVLIGNSSEDSMTLKRSSIDNINLLEDLPQTIPSEIIDQRPDILKSEAEMQAAVLDVKLARKDFLPSINLSGLSGFNAYSMSSLFNWQSYVMAGSAGVAQQLFTGGQLKARLRAKKYRYEQMLENYQKTLLTSVQEINDSLVAVKFDTRKNNNNLKRIKFGKSQYDDISYKYEKGAISYLDTLQYKENLLVLEKEQTQSKTDCLIDSLSLYKSVGGKL